MREVLLALNEPPEQALIKNFQVSIGRVYEDEGERFDPLEPTLSRPKPEWLSSDFIIQANSEHEFVYRPWQQLTTREKHIGGFLVDVLGTAKTGEPVVMEIPKDAIEMLVIGDDSVLAGVTLGVVYRIIQRYETRSVAPIGDLTTATAVRKNVGLRYEPFFRNADTVLSAALRKPTSVYNLTAELAREKYNAGKNGS
ncbi:MAG: hypothetical protein M3Q36_01885 [bacterium]|nr:hypothetical protein [bacterium]